MELGVNAPVAARILFDASHNAAEASAEEARKLRAALSCAEERNSKTQAVHADMVSNLQAQMQGLRTELSAARTQNEALDLKMKERATQQSNMVAEIERLNVELTAAQAAAAGARREAFEDAGQREAALREALQTTRDCAENKVQVARASADRAAQEQKAAAESAREAWAQAKAATETAAKQMTALEASERSTNRTLEILEAERAEARAQAELAAEQMKQAAASAQAKMDALREQASEQAQWAALSERKFLEQKAVAAKLEETVAMLKERLADIQTTSASRAAQALAQSYPQSRRTHTAEDAGALAVQRAPESDSSNGHPTDPQPYSESRRLHAARVEADRRWCIAEKRAEADQLMLEGQQQLLAQASAENQGQKAELAEALQAAQAAQAAAEHRVRSAQEGCAQMVEALKAETALAQERCRAEAAQSAGEAHAARLARDKALVDVGHLQAEKGEMREALLALREENSKLVLLHDAELKTMRTKYRLLEEESRAEKVAAVSREQAQNFKSAAPFTALRDASAAELELASARARRLMDENASLLAVAQGLRIKLDHSEKEAAEEQERLGANLVQLQDSLDQEKRSNCEMAEKLQGHAADVKRIMEDNAMMQEASQRELERLKQDMDKECARRMMAESRVEALYVSLGSQRDAAASQASVLTNKNQELSMFLEMRVKEVEIRETAVHELAAKQAIEADIVQKKLRDQLTAREGAYHQCLSERQALETEVETLRRQAHHESSKQSALFNQDRLSMQETVAEYKRRNQQQVERVAELEAEVLVHLGQLADAKVLSGQMQSKATEAQERLEALNEEHQKFVQESKSAHNLVTTGRDEQQRLYQVELKQAHDALAAQIDIAKQAEEQQYELQQELDRTKEEHRRSKGYEAVLQLDESVCQICRSVVVDPHTVSSCNHTFCKTCICDSLMNELKCPAPKCGRRASRADLIRNVALGNLLERVQSRASPIGLLAQY
eukprot:CAMPEP_0114308774 /NCGR_PEP_ID=MMETSP0059-20121206/18256_1 /TAXON_ID=36894 /ORGANISM="Pyramimonas parkeae, Strain CCMP726" /LENGTH=967 /DNA_ID=CAMNT_0001432475 /DNA_START=37 /DNA_END=2940 /DNA_ORIENTATION=-